MDCRLEAALCFGAPVDDIHEHFVSMQAPLYEFLKRKFSEQVPDVSVALGLREFVLFVTVYIRENTLPNSELVAKLKSFLENYEDLNVEGLKAYIMVGFGPDTKVIVGSANNAEVLTEA